MAGTDPYRIADVVVPWLPDDDFDMLDVSEWPAPDLNAQIVAKGKRDEARNRGRTHDPVDASFDYMGS